MQQILEQYSRQATPLWSAVRQSTPDVNQVENHVAVCDRHLQSDYQEVLSGGLKTGTLVDIFSQQINDYLSAKMEDDGAQEGVKELVLRSVETKSGQWGAPMGVDRLGFEASPDGEEERRGFEDRREWRREGLIPSWQWALQCLWSARAPCGDLC